MPYPGLEYGQDILRLARSTDGARSFAPAVDVLQNEGLSVTSGTFHDLLTAPNGRVYVAWLDYRENLQEPKPVMTNVQVRLAWSDDGGQTFRPSVLVNGVSCECCRVALVRGQDGMLYLGWRGIDERPNGDDPIRDMKVTRSVDGGQTWDTPTKIHDDRWAMSECPHSGPALQLDATGRLHAAWYTGKDGGPGVYYAVSDDGGRTFSNPLALLTDEWVPHSVVRMSLGTDNGAWVTWEDLRGDPGTIQVSRVGPDGDLVGGAEGFPGYTSAVIGAATGAVVAWVSDDGIRIAAIPAPSGGNT